MVVQHLRQIEKVEKLNKWVPHELITNQENHHFEVSSSLILGNNNELFLDQIVTCNKKWILYDNGWQPAQWLNQEEPPKHFHSQICTKKMSWSGEESRWRRNRRGDHFLFHKFIERTTERWTKFTKQLLIASSGHQAPRKAAHCLRREVGQKY